MVPVWLYGDNRVMMCVTTPARFVEPTEQGRLDLRLRA
jgi:hypothetical protein